MVSSRLQRKSLTSRCLPPSETFPPLFTILVRLLHYDGVLQPIRNLLRFLQIDTASRYSQKKKEQKENEKPSPVVDKSAP